MGYILALKEKLHLPTTINKMLFPKIAALKPEDLKHTCKEVKEATTTPKQIAKILCKSPFWSKGFIETAPSYKTTLKQRTSAAYSKLRELKKQNSGQYNTESKKIMKERDEEIAALKLKVAMKWLKNNPLKDY